MPASHGTPFPVNASVLHPGRVHLHVFDLRSNTGIHAVLRTCSITCGCAQRGSQHQSATLILFHRAPTTVLPSRSFHVSRPGLHHNSAPLLPSTTGSPRRVNLLRASRPLSTPSPSTMSWCSSSKARATKSANVLVLIQDFTFLAPTELSTSSLPISASDPAPKSITRSYQRDTPTMMFSMRTCQCA